MAVIVRWGARILKLWMARHAREAQHSTALPTTLVPVPRWGFPTGGCSLPTPICKYKYMLIVKTKHLLFSLGFYIYSTNVYWSTMKFKLLQEWLRTHKWARCGPDFQCNKIYKKWILKQGRPCKVSQENMNKCFLSSKEEVFSSGSRDHFMAQGTLGL